MDDRSDAARAWTRVLTLGVAALVIDLVITVLPLYAGRTQLSTFFSGWAVKDKIANLLVIREIAMRDLAPR